MIVSKKDYDWLIQRARRADELEYRVGLETRRSENLSRQNQRYKQALEFASSELYQALITGDINDKENRIREVMEKVDEVLEGENGR